MIDLAKLEAKFEALFQNETEESFNKWLVEKEFQQLIDKLGVGAIEQLCAPISNHTKGSLIPEVFTSQTMEIQGGNTQYAMAA